MHCSRTFAVFVEFQRLGDVLERFPMMMFLLGKDGSSRPDNVTPAACRGSGGSGRRAWTWSGHVDDGGRRRRGSPPCLGVLVGGSGNRAGLGGLCALRPGGHHVRSEAVDQGQQQPELERHEPDDVERKDDRLREQMDVTSVNGLGRLRRSIR